MGRKRPYSKIAETTIRTWREDEASKAESTKGLRQESVGWHDTAKYEEDTKKYMSGQTSKKRKEVEGWAYAETKGMQNEDSFSHFNNVLDCGGGRLDRIPKPKFATGQSCFQWWAKWMLTATEMPKSYKENNRPKWYSGEIMSYSSYGAMRYCGIMQVPQHIYASNLSNGTSELVPEMFLMAREPGAKSRHCNGLLEVENQGPPPIFWESFNTTNVNIIGRR